MVNIYTIYKKIMFTVVFLLTVMGLTKTVKADTVIPKAEFEDENFYQYIIENFDTNGDSLLQVSEAEAVTEINLIDVTEKITSIKGIEYFTELQYLDLGISDHETDLNQIKSLEPIRNLNKVISFGISYNSQITDYSPLSNLPLLETVSLYKTDIQDISVIEKLNIKFLRLFECENIIDYTPIAKMTGLNVLDLDNNKNFSNITVFKNLKELENIDLSGTNITDISSLANLENIRFLNLTGTAVTDLSPLAVLVNLEELYLEETDVTDISVLANLTKLTKLNMNMTGITDLSPLINLIKLEYLDINFCDDVKDYSYIGGLKNLTQLSMAGCGLKDIQWLEGHTNITDLNMGFNSVKILPDMTDWTNLRNIYFVENEITEEEAVAKLPAHITSQVDWKQIVGIHTQYNNENETNDNTQENVTPENPDDGRIITSPSDSSISVQGQLESDIYLEAVKIENTSDYDNLIRQINNSLTDIIDTSIYDIWLYKKEIKEGENVKIKVQPNGNVKVMIKIE